MAPETLSCRFLSTSTASGPLPALASLAPWRAPLDFRGGVVDLCRGLSVFFLRRLFPFFPILSLISGTYKRLLSSLLWPFSPFHLLGDTLLVTFGTPLGWTFLLLFLDI